MLRRQSGDPLSTYVTSRERVTGGLPRADRRNDNGLVWPGANLNGAFPMMAAVTVVSRCRQQC